MITFFRRIRQKLIDSGSVTKYLLYAIGEILLVVIGILIALQVNNWNEERKEIATEKVIVESAIESLRRDSVLIVYALAELDRIDQLHQQIFEYTRGELQEEDIGDLMYLRRSLLYNPITKNNHPDLANEVLRQDMKQLIRSYYQSMDNSMDVVIGFNVLIENKIRPKLIEARVNQFGFQFMQNADRLLGLTNINRDAMIDYLKDPGFQNLLVEVGTKYIITRTGLKDLQVENADLIKQLTAYSK